MAHNLFVVWTISDEAGQYRRTFEDVLKELKFKKLYESTGQNTIAVRTFKKSKRDAIDVSKFRREILDKVIKIEKEKNKQKTITITSSNDSNIKLTAQGQTAQIIHHTVISIIVEKYIKLNFIVSESDLL